MKNDKYIVPGALGIWRYRNREGPPISYIVWKNNSTRGFGNKQDALKYISWPKSLPTGQAIREWFDQFDDESVLATPLDEFHQQIEKEGFGPEAHADDPDPTANTKMVT